MGIAAGGEVERKVTINGTLRNQCNDRALQIAVGLLLSGYCSRLSNFLSGIPRCSSLPGDDAGVEIWSNLGGHRAVAGCVSWRHNRGVRLFLLRQSYFNYIKEEIRLAGQLF
jgi:hypothetical protein